MNAFRRYIGEIVLVRGSFCEILRCELRGRELRFIAYNDDLNQEVSLSVKEVATGLVAEEPA